MAGVAASNERHFAIFVGKFVRRGDAHCLEYFCERMIPPHVLRINMCLLRNGNNGIVLQCHGIPPERMRKWICIFALDMSPGFGDRTAWTVYRGRAPCAPLEVLVLIRRDWDAKF